MVFEYVAKEECGMYEKLTAYIPKMKKASHGRWAEEHGDGSPENPFHMPFVVYNPYVTALEDEIVSFVDKHGEMNLADYGSILREHGLEWSLDSMRNADVSSLDGKTVMALLVGAIRAERFCDGALLDFCRSGCVLRWLERLKAIDDRG